MDELNIDDFVNYEAEYSAVIKHAQIRGNQLTGRCPFHDDKVDSFSADLTTGKCHCFAGCIDGNFITFWAMLRNIDSKEAYKEILDKYGKLEDPKEKKQAEKPKPNNDFTLSEYAFNKHLPEDWLKSQCGAVTAKDRDGTQYLKLPYYNEENTSPIFRKRYAKKQFRWSWGSSGKLILYGDWRLPEIREKGYALIVEGESDTQTLWYLKFAALGVPGASNFNERMVPKLKGLKLYLHVEPDKGGETFLTKATRILYDGDWDGDIYTWNCSQYGVKDPSDLYAQEGAEKATELIQNAVNHAKRLNLEEKAIPEAIEGAPVRLRQPEGWLYSDKGISHIDEKTALPTLVCRTPIILTQRLKSMETGEEKIEIAFKRDGEWSRAIFLRSTIFTSRSITALADLGCTVTSENAKQVVSFLAALESENIDIITKAESTSSFGWQTRGRFLPGHGDDIVLDIEPSLRGWAAAYHTAGSFSTWKDMMRPHRERDKFRFILAASFAAPLLRILQQRTFFVYNWGGSKGGKTAALKAALSAWGDPEQLMVNFNATQVALERMAGFYTDLPLGIDERQLAGNKQESLEKIVYMISSGTGRARGSKGGGLQQLNTWRTVALATGEEPLATETSQTGVSTRVLEIYGGPFDDEKSASLMHQQTPLNCGWAGPEFITYLLATDERSIADAYDRMTAEVYAMANGTSGAHISGISAVALADAMIDTWIFGEERPEAEPDPENKQPLKIRQESWDRAVRMAKSIIDEQLAIGSMDVNEHATQYIVDWILSNRQQFGEKAIGTCLGMISETQNKAYIFPSLLNQALQKAGYSPRKTLKYLGDKGIITSTVNAKGVKEYCVRKWFDNKTCRFVEFDLGRFVKQSDPLEEDEAAADIEKSREEDDGFMPLPEDANMPFPFDNSDDGQEELPF